MFFNSVVKILNNNYENICTNDYNKVDPGLVRFFRTEYGSEWRSALDHHLYMESQKNDKKAA